MEAAQDRGCWPVPSLSFTDTDREYPCPGTSWPLRHTVNTGSVKVPLAAILDGVT